ncbi:MAG TPA: NusG domain II-containing protein [Solimonas sp.]
MTRGDAVAIALAAALIGALYAQHWQPAVDAGTVEIRRDGELAGRYPLSQARSLTVSGHLGDSTIEIRDGQVRFRQAPCRNQVCVHRGWLRHAGDAAACLPNRISLRLGGQGQGDVPDALSH